MATKTMVKFIFRDAYGKRTSRSYRSKDDNPSDGDVQALATDAQAISALSLIKATVSREVDVTGITDAAEAKSSRQKDASIVYNKSSLGDSLGGTYTFNITEPKAALVDSAGKLILTAGAWDNWRENFDDGAGIGGVAGNFYVSEQEELVEDDDPIDGFLNKD